MGRFLVTLLVLALGIGLFVMAGTVLLPVFGLLLIIWFLAALFRSGQRSVPESEYPEEEPVEEIPASQAVIDVEAVAVTGDEPAEDKK